MILDNEMNQQEINDELQHLDDLLADLEQHEDQVPVKIPEPAVRWRNRDRDGNELFARPRSSRNKSRHYFYLFIFYFSKTDRYRLTWHISVSQCLHYLIF